MANITKQKREKMISFLRKIKEKTSDDETIIALNEIENQLTDKKFGLVFEEHNEQADEMLKDNIPVLEADCEKRICKDQNLPWNFIIEGDNLHALHLLEKTHRGKVDCIYIDPPYNTGAHDWKYNNDYVDEKDSYRHSKWLSMMKSRLVIAKGLLKPKNSVLICTIDEKEFLHIGCLLEEIFPMANIQMVSTIIKPEGTQRSNEFSRTNEFIFFVMNESSVLTPNSNNMFDSGDVGEQTPLPWRNLRRRENRSTRGNCPNQFYPFFINATSGCIHSIGDALDVGVDRNSIEVPDGCYALFPLTPYGKEMTWGALPETVRTMYNNGYIKATNGEKGVAKAGIKYLLKGVIKDINNGLVTITGKGKQGEIEGYYESGNKSLMPKTIWNVPSHNAQVGGSLLIKNILGDVRFPYPKSLYAVHDALRFFVGKNKDAIILDFFAGSGTTLHAVNLLNKEDDGNRKCIIVTNNEVSEEEEINLIEKGFKKGDPEWEALGIANYVTWPRIKNSILGKREDGSLIEDFYATYLTVEEQAKRRIEVIDFVDENLTRQNKGKLLSYISSNTMPKKLVTEDCDYVVSQDVRHHYSILFNINKSNDWITDLEENAHITDLFVVTKSKKEFDRIKNDIESSLDNITLKNNINFPISDGFKANVKYFKCNWIERRPENYLLSNALCFHVREMIELQNHIEIDNKKNILLLTKEDYKKYVLNNENKNNIRKIWANQNIIFDLEEIRELKKYGFKYIPKEFFGQELKEVAE